MSETGGSGSKVIRATKPTSQSPRKMKVNDDHRTCPVCGTVLSRYNTGAFCFRHTEPKLVYIRKGRDVKRRK